jgi:hypothetical protein
MENHVKYHEAVYDQSRDGQSLYVNLFIASELTWPQKDLTLRQQTAFPYEAASRLVFSCRQPVPLTVRIRKPFWCEGFRVFLNDQPQTLQPDADGYVALSSTFRDGDTIRLELPMTLRLESMPDNPDRIAFFYGPILLAADLDGDQPLPVLIGRRQALLASLKPSVKEPLVFEAPQAGHVLGGTQPRDLTFRPLYNIVDQKYTVYLDIFTTEQWNRRKAEYEAEQKRRQEMEARTVDVIDIGRMQPERDHNLVGDRTRTGEHAGRQWRDAYEGGWFAFEMKVLPDAPVDLVVTYWGSETGPRQFDILIDDTKIAAETLGADKPNEFYEKVYPIPEELTRGKQKVTVRFQAHPGCLAGGIFGCRTIRR